METATLTSPSRPLMVQPIQKSLSLPSYARAGGEGIDHKIIFAALEQREKIRRKSKIFKDKEKCGTTRQNYFCLPLPSTAKCRETSFSSDTSCSSLEFQKPKRRSSPAKLRNIEITQKSLQNGLTQTETITPSSPGPIINNVVHEDVTEQEGFKLEPRQPLRGDVSRSTIGSSDSMERTERSSKSSNDSLSRKERLIAIKARVEAEREKKLCASSSDEETGQRIVRNNSDGVIHRTVREVKTKHDRRYRRKTQDEMTIRRTLRKQHTSLYLPPTTDFDAWKPPILRCGSSFSLQRDFDEFNKEFNSCTDRKTDCNQVIYANCVSDYKNYFSDICSGSLASRVVKSRVQEMEFKQLESKLMETASRKTKTEQDIIENKNHISTNQKRPLKIDPHTKPSDNYHDRFNFRDRLAEDSSRKCPSPISRAPTPPPRSPKSIDFVNKAFLQHQNFTNFLQEGRSLERKKSLFRSNVTGAVADGHDNGHQVPNGLHIQKPNEASESSVFTRRNRDVTNLRRRTLCNFPQVEEIIAAQRPKTPTSSYRAKHPSHNFPPRSPDLSHRLGDSSRRTKGYASGSDTSLAKTILQPDLQVKKWEKLELDSEKKFNSLENRSNANLPTWSKDRIQFGPQHQCLCVNSQNCLCGQSEKPHFKVDQKYSEMFQIGSVECPTDRDLSTTPGIDKTSKSMPTSKTSPVPIDRLSKSEANLAKRSPPKTPSPRLKPKNLHPPKHHTKESDDTFSFSCENASENLNTAMEELENVYRSLRISNENLSISTNHNYPIENIKSNKVSPSKPPTKSAFHLRNRLAENSIPNQSYDPFHAEDNINKNNCASLSVNKLLSNASSANPSGTKSTLRETLCIEELFSDLTQQLDFEQKLLQESKNKPPSRSGTPQQLNSSSTQELSKPSKYPPINVSQSVSVFEDRKCRSPVEEFKKSDLHSEIRNRMAARRKRQAVGLLSTNLSHLMKGNADLLQTGSVIAQQDHQNPNVLIDNTSHSHVNLETVINTSEGPVVSESSSLCQKSEDSDEIWQVRVSMSSGNMPKNSKIKPVKLDLSSSTYSRLRSALRLPPSDSSRDPSPCPNSSNFLEKRKDDDSNELEKMLTNLLNEVPKTELKNIPSPTDKKLKDSDKPKTIIKDVSQHVEKPKYYLLNMDGSNNPTDVMENEKRKTESHKNGRENFSKGKMDNDSIRNNNYSSQTQRLSFIPVRSRDNHQGKYALPKYKSFDDNRGVTTHRISSYVGNSVSPASPFQSGARRHSLGIDNLSNDFSIHLNSNQDQRYQSLGRRTKSPALPNTASITYNSTPLERLTNNPPTYQDPLCNGKSNQNDMYQSIHRGSNNASPRPSYGEPTHLNEKAKDKSFIRKSSLNRIEFVNSAHQVPGGTTHMPCFYTPDQHSTSDANSDNQQRPLPSTDSSSVKRKSNSFRLNRKEPSGRQIKEDFPDSDTRKGESQVCWGHAHKLQERSISWRNKRAGFKKKSYSAGEQDSLTDHSDILKRDNVCFSAQEIDSPEYQLKRVSKKITLFQPKKPLRLSPDLPYKKFLKSSWQSRDETTEVHPVLKDQQNACDNTSQMISTEALGASDEMSQNADSVQQKCHEEATVTNVTFNEIENTQCEKPPLEEEPLDGDLFVCSNSSIPQVLSNPFPTDDIEPKLSLLSASVKNNEDNKTNPDTSVESHDVANVASDMANLEISTDSLETDTVDTDADPSKQRSSILRKKQSDEKRGIQGILKHAGDEKLCWQPLSILKHRESSEEKDNWSQSDLHSILKKSASEDESCNGSPDIRPILKNTSTDEDSSGLNSKPKPILKKRTSFSEECSYACFLSGELKPILKKTTLSETSEDQPRPILKTRRKSEEATASISEFPLGTRPRAYSADRGVRMCSGKRTLDEDLT